MRESIANTMHFRIIHCLLLPGHLILNYLTNMQNILGPHPAEGPKTYHELVLSLYEGYGQYTGSQGFISQAQLRRFAIHIFEETRGLGLERFQPQ